VSPFWGSTNASLYWWGSAIDHTRANYGNTGIRKTVPVDSFEPNPWGLNALHRGTLKTVLSRAQSSCDFHKVQDWLQKIVTLLNHHQISLIDAKHEYWVIMHAEEDGRVQGLAAASASATKWLSSAMCKVSKHVM
jgi:hypothetical protein